MYNCPTCNEPFELGTKYCPKCGCNLEESFIENPVCPKCHKNYPAGSTFCPADGAKLVSPEKLIPKCVICGAQYPSDTKFCPKDGGAIIPEAFRYATQPSSPNSNSDSDEEYYEKADFGRRLLAWLLDCLIIFALNIPAFILLLVGFANIKTSYSYYSPDYDFSQAITWWLFAFVASLPSFIYGIIKDGIGEGQSWGKKALGLKVIKVEDSSDCTKGASALRWLITMLIEWIPIIGWLIEPIMVLATNDGRRLADKAAGTMVVKA